MSLSKLTPLTLQAVAQPAFVPASSRATPKSSTTGIKAIPSAVFGRILSFLPAQQITICLHHVCQDWHKLPLVNDGYLDLSGLPNLSDSDLKTILDQASSTRITSINLSNCKKITDAGLEHLSKLTSLSSLNLDGCENITDAGLAHLSKLTSLNSLDLSECHIITNAGLSHLSKLTSLNSLDLSECHIITNAGLSHLSKLTLLSSLNLSRCNKITGAGLEHLSKLTLLSSLNLSFCYNITDAGLAHLATLTSLSTLSLIAANITDAGLAHLSKLTSLSSLDLSLQDITDVGIAHLTTLTSLSSLDLSDNENITDAGLEHLSKLILLSSLNLKICPNISDAGLEHLSKLTLLSSLNLDICPNITDAGLAHLSKLTLLSSLSLIKCKKITDAGLAHLSKLTLLSSLKILLTGITWGAEKAFEAKLIPVAFKDVAFRDRMDYYIYMLAPQPKGGAEWGKKNRYIDLDRLKLAQSLAALELSHPELLKELSIDSLLDLINQPSSTEQLDQSLHKLPAETRNAIFYQVYQLAPEPKEGDQWGEKHCFDDLARFRLAVIKVIKSRVPS